LTSQGQNKLFLKIRNTIERRGERIQDPYAGREMTPSKVRELYVRDESGGMSLKGGASKNRQHPAIGFDWPRS